MSGSGNHGVLVTCNACEGSGARQGITRVFEVKTLTCEICLGTGKITVPRKI